MVRSTNMMREKITEVQEPTLDTLKHEGIAAFDVGLTAEETNAIENVSIEVEPEDFDYYGNSESELQNSVQKHLLNLGPNNAEILETIARLATRVVEETKARFQKTSAWITLRVFLPSTDHDTPRWHSDGHYVKHEDDEFVSEEYKLVFAIKGAPTRFQDFDVSKGQAALYRVGEQGKNIHSEPRITEPRIFMSVIVGSEAQIAELKSRFH